MSRNFGTTINTPVESTGASFVLQRHGFDTGTRIFTVDNTKLARLPKLGDRDSRYPRMFVSSQTRTNGKLGIVVATVSYEGLMAKTKRDFFTVSTTEQTFSDVPVVTGNTITGTVRWHRSLPQVTHIYVTDKYPNPLEVGTAKEPPKYAGRVAAFYGSQWRPGYIRIFSGWKLSSRAVRESGPLFEVTDVYGLSLIHI
jgi:hypothetical protein